jgi:TPR repeat protein
MVDHAPRYPSYNTDNELYEEPTRHVAPYQFGQPARTNYPDESAPLFLSSYDDEPDPAEYMPPVRRRGSYFSSRILAAVLASTAIGIFAALFNSDAARDFIASAKASSNAVLSAASAAVQPSSVPQVPQKPRDVPLKDTARLSAPESQTPGFRNIVTAAVTPTREDIKSAYQSALQVTPPQAAAAPEPAIPADAVHHLDPVEIASSLKRADALIASGDVAAARLVLHRAADAGDARAAMTLAGTYDPIVLEKLAVRGVVPDLAMARNWYEKARQFGAPEAVSRLELLASRQH